MTLIRRVTLDLTGLPPTPEDTDAFIRDTASDAWEKVIDRLLASPHYGERWGRHWLDLVRYADSNGFEHDEVRPDAWRYRDDPQRRDWRRGPVFVADRGRGKRKRHSVRGRQRRWPRCRFAAAANRVHQSRRIGRADRGAARRRKGEIQLPAAGRRRS